VNDPEVRILAQAIVRMLDRQRLDAELRERMRFEGMKKRVAAGGRVA
jgi:hypothetical protein